MNHTVIPTGRNSSSRSCRRIHRSLGLFSMSPTGDTLVTGRQDARTMRETLESLHLFGVIAEDVQNRTPRHLKER